MLKPTMFASKIRATNASDDVTTGDEPFQGRKITTRKLIMLCNMEAKVSFPFGSYGGGMFNFLNLKLQQIIGAYE